MTDRREYALTHPLNDAEDQDAIARLRSVDRLRDGNLLMVVLAVDR